MPDKTALGISEDLRQYIEALVEEVVLEGKPFENHKKYLIRFCEAEGIDSSTLSNNLIDFFASIQEWGSYHTKASSFKAKFLGRDCYLSDAFVNLILAKTENNKKTKPSNNPGATIKDAPWKVPHYRFEDSYFSFIITNVANNWVYIKGNSRAYPAILDIPKTVLHREQVFTVVGIKEYAFADITSFTIKIPDSVMDIGNHAFTGCIGLQDIELPDSVTKIGESAFARCSALKSVRLPKNLAIIPKECFCGTYLSNITLPENLIQIGENAFWYSHLQTIIIPNTVTTIGTGAFGGNKELKKAVLPHSLKAIPDSLFSEDSQLEDVLIPDTVETIGNKAFALCNLKKVVIPSSVRCIYEWAFGDNENLKYVKLPSSLKYLGSGAFWGCKRLEEVYRPRNVGVFVYEDGHTPSFDTAIKPPVFHWL